MHKLELRWPTPRPPTDYELLREIYHRHRGDFESAVARGARSARIAVPIDIPAIADALGADQDAVFGRLYYHLEPTYAPPQEPGTTAKKFFFSPLVGQDPNCVNFPLLEAVLASLWQQRRRDLLAIATAVVSFAISVASLIVSIVALT
jgi:hypothetical protein